MTTAVLKRALVCYSFNFVFSHLLGSLSTVSTLNLERLET